MLEVRDLACARGDRRLFSGLGFRLAPGKVLEVRGPNGSGKSTLLRALSGLLSPEAGSIAWNNRDIRECAAEYARVISFLGHSNALKDELTGLENVLFAARLLGKAAQPSEAMSALAAHGVSGCAHMACRSLSQGQRRRVALARLRLTTERPLWILDEPFNALDTAAIGETQQLLETHLGRGGMIVLTTHQHVVLGSGATQVLELAPS